MSCQMPSAGRGFVVGILSAAAELNPRQGIPSAIPRIRGAQEVRQGAAERNTITLGLSLFVIRGQIVEFKGTQKADITSSCF